MLSFMDYCAILASGTGSRMGITSIPKQFLPVNNRPLITYTIQSAVSSGLFDEIVIGVLSGYEDYLSGLLADYFPKSNNISVTIGRANRLGTFFSILEYIQRKTVITPNDYISMIDANRPFVPLHIFHECMQKAKENGIACPAHNVFDGVCFSEDGRYIDFIPERKKLFSIQTPECFSILRFQEAYSSLSIDQKENLLGAAEIFSACGIKPAIVKSDNMCFKITTATDLKLAEIIAKEIAMGEHV